MSAFHCTCGRKIPDNLVVRLIRGEITLNCSNCKEKWTRRKLLDQGVNCPVCTSLLKRYHRKVNSGMARVLFELWSLSERDPTVEWWHHRQFDRFGSREVHKLTWWRFVVQKAADPEDPSKKTSGNWRITDEGRKFAAGLSAVKPVAIVYQGSLVGFEGESARITDAFGEKFDYTELMAAHKAGTLGVTTGAA